MATPRRSLMSALFGQFRRQRVAPQQTAGTGGTQILGGYIQSRERNRRLRGDERYRTYSDLLTNISIVGAGVRYFQNLVSKAIWNVEPADDSAAAQEIADLVHDILHDMTTPWPRVVRRTCMYRFYGFSVQEWTAKRRPDGSLGFRDVEPRPQHTIERWDVDESGTVLGCTQRSPQTMHEHYLPRGKLLYVVDDSLSDSPEGLGLFRHLVEPGLRMERFQELEAFGFETDLRGIPVAKAPLREIQKQVERGDLSAKEAEAIIKPLSDFIEQHVRNPALGLLLDSAVYESRDERGQPVNVPQWAMELLSSGGDTLQEAVAAAIERLNREVARILGVEHLLLGGDGQGSLALSRDKTQSFGLIVDSSLTELESSVEADLIGPLAALNGWPDELLPSLKTEHAQFRDVQELTGGLRDLADAGAPLSPGDPAIDEIRDLLGLSRVPEELSSALRELGLLNAQNPPTPPTPPGQGAPPPGQQGDENVVPENEDTGEEGA